MGGISQKPADSGELDEEEPRDIVVPADSTNLPSNETREFYGTAVADSYECGAKNCLSLKTDSGVAYTVEYSAAYGDFLESQYVIVEGIVSSGRIIADSISPEFIFEDEAEIV
jgi:cytochrome c-type biogenesis protein CcmE